MWRTGEIIKKTGFTENALRHYKKKHLINPKKEENGKYDSYDEEDLNRLKQIYIFKKLGVKPKDMGEYFDKAENDPDYIVKKQLSMLEEKKKEIDRMIAMTQLYGAFGTEWFEFDEYTESMFDAIINDILTNESLRHAEELYDAKTKEERKKIWDELLVRIRTLLSLIEDEGTSMERVFQATDELKEWGKKVYNIDNPLFLTNLAGMLMSNSSVARSVDLELGTGVAEEVAYSLFEIVDLQLWYQLRESFEWIETHIELSSESEEVIGKVGIIYDALIPYANGIPKELEAKVLNARLDGIFEEERDGDEREKKALEIIKHVIKQMIWKE